MISENITFSPLQISDFPLLLKWLEEPHVKMWWDKDIIYTMDLVKEKYGSYVDSSLTQAFIIYEKNHPIGYIQCYDAYNDEKKMFDFPESLAGLDLFIGEKDYIGKGIGSFCLQKFLNDIVYKNYRYAFVDPEYKNVAAVRAYKKAGFKMIKRVKDMFYMIAMKKKFRLSVENSIALEISFKKNFGSNDHLWIFGSRANLTKKRGRY